MEDNRFANIATDPKFRPIPRKARKVKIDKRFQSMFKNKQFKVKYTTDKRGRPVNHTSNEDLRRYYELSSESSDSENEQLELETGKFVKAPQKDITPSNSLNTTQKGDKTINVEIKEKLRNLKVDYARGESALCSESSSDDAESDEEISEADKIDHNWGELDVDAERTEEATYRLAACNMDWDRIRAVDLMVLFNSFLPPGGFIKSVVIYPSEFGKARLKEEEIKGPIELVEHEVEAEGNVEENEEGSNYHMEKLREYQLKRLKYYYAVITFDSPNSANKIYTECDGMEYESSAIKLDLRFIPDKMEFQDEPKEVCDKLPEVNKYQPRFFTTTALQQAKVDLTWDETHPDRLEFSEKLSKGKMDEISEADFQTYLASSSDEENDDKTQNNEESDEESGKNVIDKYKSLLQDIEENEMSKTKNNLEMEISWGINLKEKTEKLIKQKLTLNEEKTPFQQYLEKRKEKRKEKRDQRKAANAETNNSSDSDFPSDIDKNDPYFAEEFNNSEFKKPKKPKEKLIDHNVMDQQKQAELDLLLMNEEGGKKHFSLKDIQDTDNISKKKAKKKRKNDKKVTEQKDVDNFEVNVKDERFSALFNSHHFNIDPTDPHFKKTKGMETIVNEKLRRRIDDIEEYGIKKVKRDNKKSAELSLLIKSVKRKTNEYQNK